MFWTQIPNYIYDFICENICRYFLTVCGLSLLLMMAFIEAQKLFILMNFSLSVFTLLLVLLVLCLRNHCLTKDHKDFVFSLKSFIVLTLTFRSVSDFELIFVHDVKSESKFIFFKCGHSCNSVILAPSAN